MFLKKFIFVNWGNIPNLEFEMGPVNLFSGGNGSGKTTAADAIQTIMTAAHENLFQYNPGQDETTQRGRGGKRVRSQASYVLGCDDGSYARLDVSDGYLAAVFHPTQGENGEPFTAIIAARAWLDQSGNNTVARLDDSAFYIIAGEQMSLSQFVRPSGDGSQYIVPLDKIQTLLITEYGQRAVEKYDTKRGYLRRLYGALRGLKDAVTEQEAMSAARAFSRFMAYKPVQSINKFVAEEILERKDLGEAIRSVSGQLKTIHAMERDATRLKASIDVLEQASQQGQLYIERWIELHTLDYTLAQYEYQQRQAQYVKAKKAQETYGHTLQAKESEITATQQRRQQVYAQLVSLEAQRMGVPALQQKDQLEADKADKNAQLNEQGVQLLVHDNLLQENINSSRSMLDAIEDGELMAALPGAAGLTQTLCKQLLEHGQRGEMNVQSLLQHDITNDLSALEHYLTQAREIQKHHNQWWSHWYEPASDNEKSLRDQLVSLGDEKTRQYQELDEQHRRKSREIERLETQQVNYPHYVEKALLAIRQQCPQADPRVLCDHVEVKDAKWQAAIEGYLGGARFSIVVEPAFEAESIRLVRNLPGRDNRARIIQGDKARRDAERCQLDKDSVIHVLDFTHATARYYLTASYGTVLRVDSAEALRMTRRGITADGLGSGNYSMWRCDLADTDLVFGVAARERALKAKLDELDKIQLGRQQANDRMQMAARLIKAVDGLKPLQYADAIAAILAIQREIQTLETLIGQLDLTASEALENKLQETREQEQQLAETERALHTEVGELKQQLRSSDEQCRSLSDEQEQNRENVEQWEENLRQLATVWPDFDVDARLQLADQEATELNAEAAKNQRAEVEKGLRSGERKLSEAIQAHNQQCRPGDAVIYHGSDDYDAALFKKICNVRQEIDRVYNALKNNILVEKHEQLLQLKESFNSAFVTHLCHAIHQAINSGQRQIKQLNKELQHHRFGADRETFRFDSHWIPEYREYARFFDEVIKHPGLGDEVTLFDAELSEKSRQVCDSLMAMLLDEDEQKAFRELERIADYRNYRRYEIYKEVEGKAPIALSEYGTGSGGQLETPAYIIRSAAITSAFRFAEGSNHLRMVLVDEAFSKMDETRSREVINYLTESLGLQLIFIMPTSKCGPFMDLISNEFIFAKCPSEEPRGQLNTRVLVDRKRCNQEKIKDLWANHRRTVHQQAELDFLELV